MVEIILVPDIVEPNGKTVRQNNMEKVHRIPIGTLVEVNCDYQPEHKTRQFVATHNRDCDGTPLYSITPKRNMCDDQISVDCYGDKRTEKDIAQRRLTYHNSGWSDDALIVIDS